MSVQLVDTIKVTPAADARREESAGTHEQVLYCRDEQTGLRAIIAVHNTVRGPALGGTRFYPYPTEAAALSDVLRLSQGMTFKAAAAGMPLGGGKAVIIGNPATIKTPALLAAYGRFVQRLDGMYVTAADVGTTSADLEIIRQSTPHVVGCTSGSGDSGYFTAYGVLSAMQAAAAGLWGASGLQGRSVGVEGVGKVGSHLVDLLLQQGARVVVSDCDSVALQRVTERHQSVLVVPSVRETELDVYAPCALGATLAPDSVASLRVRLVCGAANNQLSRLEVDRLLHDRGILWVPDFVANAGGLIQVGGERLGWTARDVDAAIHRVGATVFEIIESARLQRISTGQAAMQVVHSRLTQAAGARHAD